MAPIKLYMADGSCVCRAVWMATKALDVDVEIIKVDLGKMKQMKPDFVKINPQHSVPTIDDGGFVLWESRAIMTYLSEKYGSDDSLYPKDLQRRAVVDRLLYFDLGVVYKNLYQWLYPQFIPRWPEPIGPESKVKEALDQVDMALSASDYAAGDDLTVADFALLTSITLLEIVDYDLAPWTNVVAWIERCKRLPYYEECNRGLDMMKVMRQKMLQE